MLGDEKRRTLLATAHLPPDGDLRLSAGVLAEHAFGAPTVVRTPELLNFAALALSMQPRLVVHQVSLGVAHRVAETDLRVLPGEAPRLLRGSWIVEVKRPGGELLFGDTAALAGYSLGDAIFLIGLDWPDRCIVAQWRPHWGEEELVEGVVVEPANSPLIADVSVHAGWARDAARFALVLSLLLEAEGSPVRVRDESPVVTGKKKHKERGSLSRREDDWVVRRVSLGAQRREQARAGVGVGPGVAGRVTAEARVSGYLKCQRWGPGRRLRRWIYVEEYAARRWVAPRPLRIAVS